MGMTDITAPVSTTAVTSRRRIFSGEREPLRASASSTALVNRTFSRISPMATILAEFDAIVACSWHNIVMPQYSTKLGSKHFNFVNLRELMAKATPMRSGDALAGVAAANEKERAAAQRVLAELPLERFLEELLIAYEEDEVTRLIVDEHDAAAFAVVKGMSVG